MFWSNREGTISQPEIIGRLSRPPDIAWPCLLGCKRAQFELETACPSAFPLRLIETDRIVSTGVGEAGSLPPFAMSYAALV
jgi:hypothetical protein